MVPLNSVIWGFRTVFPILDYTPPWPWILGPRYSRIATDQCWHFCPHISSSDELLCSIRLHFYDGLNAIIRWLRAALTTSLRSNLNLPRVKLLNLLRPKKELHNIFAVKYLSDCSNPPNEKCITFPMSGSQFHMENHIFKRRIIIHHFDTRLIWAFLSLKTQIWLILHEMRCFHVSNSTLSFYIVLWYCNFT